MVKIGKFKVLEKSLKRSFSNVRLDILNIKGYLEKQHDIINSEISELQSQLFTVNRNLKDNKKLLGEDYVQKSTLEKKLKTQIKNLKSVQSEIEGTDSRINRINKNVSKLERESITASEFNKKSRVVSRELREIRDELDDEFEVIGDELREIKEELSKELIKNQSKMLNKKIREMDKSLEEVEDLKEDLRAILEKAKKRDKVKKEVVKLEKKVSKRPFYKQAWNGLVDFFEEDDEDFFEEKVVVKKTKKEVKKDSLGKKIWNGLVIFFTEDVEEEEEPKPKKKAKKKKKKAKKERKAWPFALLFLLFVFGLGFVLWQYSDEITSVFSSLVPEGDTAEGAESTAGISGEQSSPDDAQKQDVSDTVVEQPAEDDISDTTGTDDIPIDQDPEGVVVMVYEEDFINIVPDANDPDKDELTYTFSEPLNAEGQWQTEVGDAGIYPVSVTVSDGETETIMEFTIFVKPLEE